jgi:hypothetical protein
MTTKMSEIAEYSYDQETEHLSEREALKEYEKQKSESSRDALVNLEELRCGHWRVRTYQTEPEKQEFFRKKLNRIWRNTIAHLSK